MVAQNENPSVFLDQCINRAIVEVISTTAGIELTQMPCPLEDTCEVGEMSGLMFVSGQNPALIYIALLKSDARTLVSYMTGIDVDALSDEELNDGVAELLNMIAGRTKSYLVNTELYYQLTSPFVISGGLHGIVHKSEVKNLQKRFTASEVTITVKVFML